MYFKGLVAILFYLPLAVTAQVTTVKTDTSKAKTQASGKSYSYIITAKAKTSHGFFLVHKVEDKWFLEIPDSMLGREMLIVNRITQAATGGRSQFLGYAGDEINENTIAFYKGPGNKVFLKNISYTEISHDSSENGMYRSVLNSNLQPIAAVFDIKTLTNDSSASVIDITDYVNGDNDILFFDGGVKKQLGLTGLVPPSSYIKDIHAFTKNIEFHTVKTYMKVTNGPGGPGQPIPATYELNSSMVLLPAMVMQPRYFDDRVGYFATEYVDFDANPQSVEQTGMITRWRLEPKDKEAYLRGELTEPVQPIVYYIDPATPKKWIPYLIQGVKDWNIAFEKAGFKNAITAREAPVNDTDWNIEDANHSAIVYKPSQIPNASGPHVHDPRSGEIMESHINWYHNVMALLHNWYFIQTAATDPRARKVMFDDSLMGQLIRFVVSHEVGHTLGLRHNFGSSSTIPVDSLRSRYWLAKHGHTPSIMDYARFNYVAQPEDQIPEKDLFPGIGEYDQWAINWGYRWFKDDASRDAERIRLNNWVVSSLAQNPRLWFGTESDKDDPREQNEDLGDDAMKAGKYGIQNLQRILPHLTDWLQEPAKNADAVKTMYGELVGQYNRYIGHVLKNIGGIMTTPKTSEQSGTVVSFTSKEKQQSAMRFLQAELFATPVWLINKNIFALTGSGNGSSIPKIQDAALAKLINAATLDKLIQFEHFDPHHAYTAQEMMGALSKGIWQELDNHRSIDIYRRDLQKAYVEKLINYIKPPVQDQRSPNFQGVPKTNDGLSIVKGEAKSLLHKIRTAMTYETDLMTKEHLQDCADRLKEGLKADEN